MEAALFTPVSGIVALLPLSASPTDRAHYRLRLILSVRDSAGPTPSQPTLRQEQLPSRWQLGTVDSIVGGTDTFTVALTFGLMTIYRTILGVRRARRLPI